MRGLWTLVLMLCLVSPVGAGQRPLALPVPGGLVHAVAICAGRLSAWREHQWLLDGPGSEQTAQRLAAMTEILDAAVQPGEDRGAWALRIEAKAAQRALLQQAAFATDAAAAAQAAQQAGRLLAACEGLLLG